MKRNLAYTALPSLVLLLITGPTGAAIKHEPSRNLTPIPLKTKLSRAEFAKAMAKVDRGQTKAQVLKLIGPPDDIWPGNDSRLYVEYGQDEVWCYGSRKHHGFPNLGRVDFKDGVVMYVDGNEGTPPSPSVVSEEDLVKALEILNPRPYFECFRDGGPHTDPQMLIKCANMLMDLGRTKALAVLCESDRLRPSYDPFWLVRVAFTSEKPGGVFTRPGLGMMSPEPPKDLSTWPTCPVAIVDDLPISFFKGSMGSGLPESFSEYADRCSKEWVLKTKHLRPPDDPFSIYRKFQGPVAVLARGNGKTSVINSLVNLVHTAYFPVNNKSTEEYMLEDADLDRFHREFLALGGHWDVKRQEYVRKDGSTLKNKDDQYRPSLFKFKDIAGHVVEVVYYRNNPFQVWYGMFCLGGGPEIEMATGLVEDALSGKQVFKTHVSTSGGVGYNFEFKAGRKLRFVVLYDGKRYESPVFTP